MFLISLVWLNLAGLWWERRRGVLHGHKLDVLDKLSARGAQRNTVYAESVIAEQGRITLGQAKFKLA